MQSLLALLRHPVVFGVIVSTVLSGTLVIAGLKAGITPGVSPLVILCAWGVFPVLAGLVSKRSLNLAQVAGSAGMAVTSGVIFTAPLVQILHADLKLPVPAVDVVSLIIVSIAGALIGFGFVGLATGKFLTDPTLPAPEARACEAMIDAAVAEKAQRPRMFPSLGLGFLLSFLAPLLTGIGLFASKVSLWKANIQVTEGDTRSASVDLPFAPIYIGIGGLLTLATAMLVAGGSFLRLLGDGMLAYVPAESALQFPGNSMRWVGGGAMTVAVLYSLVRFMGKREKSTEDIGDPALLVVDHGMKRFLSGSILVGAVVLVGWLIYSEGGLTLFGLSMSAGVMVMATLMVTLGAILSLQIGSSASPVSGTIFVTTLVLCLVALAVGRNEVNDVILLTPLLVGACVAVCTANDSSQDYKTMQFCGVRVQDGFVAQILGLLGGCIIVPIVLYIAHGAYTLGSPDLAAPQGKMFATLVQGLLLNSNLPWAPIGIGLGIGLVAVLIDIAASKRGVQLPSMALAVGIYLPAAIGVGILIGSSFRWAAERGKKQTNESILAAAGLITGAAAFELILGTLIVAGASDGNITVFRGMPTWVPSTMAIVGILALGMLLYRNSLPQGETPAKNVS